MMAVARVVDVLDDLFGLPVTLSAVGVLVLRGADSTTLWRAFCGRRSYRTRR